MGRYNGRKRKPKNKTKKMTYKMQINFIIVFIVVLLLFLGLIFRMVYILREKGTDYEKKALSQQSYVSNVISYKRGSIMDRNGTVVAKSDKFYNVIFDPKVLNSNENSVDVTLDALCEVFDLEKTYLLSILSEKADSSYVVLLKNVEYEKYEQFEQKKQEAKDASTVKRISGVVFEETYVRTYPYGSSASNVIGFSNSSNEGIFGGLEQYYNDELNGTNGRIYGYYDSELNLQRTVKKATNGHDLITTIDLNVQRLVEEKIVEFNERMGCENIGVLLMNPNNGEIYAMASNEGYDLNNPRDISNYYTEHEIEQMTEDEKIEAAMEMWQNFCISYSFEPGSTFKPFTVAAALEENHATPHSSYLCMGRMHVGGWEITCNRKSGHGYVSLAESLMKSCNPAMMLIVEDMGRDYFYKYQIHFGFGKETGIDLPGENAGVLIAPGRLNVTELATSSFGQGFNVNMVQLAAAYSSLVNGGHYYQPHIVKEIVNENGATVSEVDSSIPVKETVSKSTSDFIREAAYLTVEDGTAGGAKVEGYLVGGKTGTAQKGIRNEKRYVVSFIGSVPADNPELVIYVVIDEVADKDRNSFSSVATELTSELLEVTLPFLGIYPEGEIEYHVELPQVIGTDAQGGQTEDGTEIPIYTLGDDESNPDVLPDGLDADFPDDANED